MLEGATDVALAPDVVFLHIQSTVSMTVRPVRQALHQVHSIVGLVMSLVLTCIGVTGALMSFEDEIVDYLNRDIMHVAVQSVAMLTPDQMIKRIESANAGARVSGLTMTNDPASAVRVRFAREAQGVRRSSIYIDPYDGRILGTPAGEETFATIRRLHRRLLLPGDGDGVGRWITGAAVVSLLALLITGIVLRWPRKVRSLKVWLKPNLALHGRGFLWSLHSVIGTWLIPIYLVTILTGLWWSYDWYKDAATWLLTGKERPVAGQKMAKGGAPEAGKDAKGSAKAPRAPQGDRAAPSLDPAWSAFRERFGATYGVATFMVPSGAGNVVRVRSVPKDAPSEAARDEIRIDGVTGRIVSAELYADKKAGEIVIARVLDIHTGSMFGLIGRIVFMLAAALMPLFMVTGYLLYLSRRRLRAAALSVSKKQDALQSSATGSVHGSLS